MNLFKKLLCEHEYKYYYKEKVCEAWRYTPDFKFYFVCPKCQKRFAIKDSDIEGVYKEFKHEVALQQALGTDEMPTTSFCIPYALRDGKTNIRMSGPAAYKTREHFLKTGIDITQIKD